jgi:BNR repeat-containing family member/PKD domain
MTAAGGRRASIALSVTFALAALAASLATPTAAAPLRSLGGGAWSWFGDPRAIHHEGAHSRTYVGWIDPQGDVKVASYDHRTRVRTTAVLRWRLGADDHDNPSLHVLADGRLLIFYSHHSGPRMYYRKSARPEDVTAWGRERTVPTNSGGNLGYTYPNPVQLSAENDRLWLFWRGGNYSPTFSRSEDDGRTWSSARTLIDYRAERPYVKYETNERDTIHFAFTQGHPRDVNANIYYARYRRGRLLRASGEPIKSLSNLPLAPRQADKVYDTTSRAWVHDIALDARGRPVIVFAIFPSDGDHRYRYARWTGRRWTVSSITRAGDSISDDPREAHYSGGITLDHENPQVVYLSREVGGVNEVETWRTPDGGASWTRRAVTSNSSVPNVRPISPRGLLSFDDDFSLVWMRGRYDTYLTYNTDITTRLLSGGNLPPIAEVHSTPRIGTHPLAVEFNATASRDPDGRISRLEWDFGDGTRTTGATPSHTYESPGRYFVKTVVTDDGGSRDTFVTEIWVR